MQRTTPELRVRRQIARLSAAESRTRVVLRHHPPVRWRSATGSLGRRPGCATMRTWVGSVGSAPGSAASSELTSNGPKVPTTAQNVARSYRRGDLETKPWWEEAGSLRRGFHPPHRSYLPSARSTGTRPTTISRRHSFSQATCPTAAAKGGLTRSAPCGCSCSVSSRRHDRLALPGQIFPL